MLSIIPVLPWSQGGCRREWLRAKDNRYKVETEMSSFPTAFSSFMGPKNESVLFSKSSLSTSHTALFWICSTSSLKYLKIRLGFHKYLITSKKLSFACVVIWNAQPVLEWACWKTDICQRKDWPAESQQTEKVVVWEGSPFCTMWGQGTSLCYWRLPLLAPSAACF
jgi:hypothetical protein